VPELPGFLTIRDGEVYASSAVGDTSRILLVQRWRTPTADEMVDELFAESLLLDRPRCELPLYKQYVAELLAKREMLQAHLVLLPNEVIDDLRSRNTDLEMFLRDRLDLPDPPDHSLELLAGTLPSHEVSSSSHHWYEERLQTIERPGMGVQWLVKLLLDGNGTLPSRKDVFMAVAKRTESSCFFIDPDTADAAEVTQVLDAIYRGSSGAAFQFSDGSRHALRQFGCDVARDMPRLIKRNLLLTRGRDPYALFGEPDERRSKSPDYVM